MRHFFSFIVCFSTSFFSLFAQSQVVPCQLSNPDQDTLRLFPERTNYRTEFMRTDEVGKSRNLGPKELYRDLERRLNDSWDPIWETEDIPYVFYEIVKGPEKIGWVFGANQGWPGADNSQLMVALDLDERIQEFYYQKLPSMENENLQTSHFYAQFLGLSLEQFYIHEQLENLKIHDTDLQALDMIRRIQDPTKNEHEGFLKTLRGLKKILVYLDDFKFHHTIKKENVVKNVDTLVKNRDTIPLLNENDVLQRMKNSFHEGSRYVVDLVSVESHRKAMEERLEGTFGKQELYPIYVLYKDKVYKEPFVRGILLGYMVPVSIGSFTGVVSIGAQGNDKGKILSLSVHQTDFPQFKGLSLVHFYTKDFLTKERITDEKLDRIAPLKNLKVGDKDLTDEIKNMAKKALVLVDEVYFHTFFEKEEIMKKIKEYVLVPPKDSV